MRKKGLMIAGLTMVLGIGGAIGASGAIKQVIRMEGGKRIEESVGAETAADVLAMKQSAEESEFVGEIFSMEETSATGENGMEEFPAEDAAGADAGEGVDEGEQMNLLDWDLIKMWGVMTENLDGGFVIDSHVPDGYQGEVVIHVDPKNTLVLDSVTGFPAQKEQLQTGGTVYVYVSPAMTMSLPPQTTAGLVLVNVPQDAGAPEFVTAAAALEADGEGNYWLTATSGAKIKIPADCPITPYLTRQMVRLEDITEGRHCLIWLDGEGKADRIVLFNE